MKIYSSKSLYSNLALLSQKLYSTTSPQNKISKIQNQSSTEELMCPLFVETSTIQLLLEQIAIPLLGHIVYGKHFEETVRPHFENFAKKINLPKSKFTEFLKSNLIVYLEFSLTEFFVDMYVHYVIKTKKQQLYGVMEEAKQTCREIKKEKLSEEEN